MNVAFSVAEKRALTTGITSPTLCREMQKVEKLPCPSHSWVEGVRIKLWFLLWLPWCQECALGENLLNSSFSIFCLCEEKEGVNTGWQDTK